MEITPKNPIPLAPYVNPVQQNPPASETNGEKGRAAGEDSVELSQNARDVQKAQQILRDLPDIRKDKVEALKQQVASGTYDIRADKIAAKMIKESLMVELS